MISMYRREEEELEVPGEDLRAIWTHGCTASKASTSKIMGMYFREMEGFICWLVFAFLQWKEARRAYPGTSMLLYFLPREVRGIGFGQAF